MVRALVQRLVSALEVGCITGTRREPRLTAPFPASPRFMLILVQGVGSGTTGVLPDPTPSTMMMNHLGCKGLETGARSGRRETAKEVREELGK